MTEAVERLVRATVDMGDAEMGRAWAWRMYDEEGLRFALLMTHHELRDLAVRLAAAREREPSQAQRILAQYHEAYRDLSAVLAAVPTTELDRPPAEGEWPVRDVAEHILGAEYGFLTVCAFALERHRSGNAAEPTDDEWKAFSTPRAAERAEVLDALGAADVRGVRDAFAGIHIRVLRELWGVSDAELEKPAWFWDGAMPIRFRLHRFEEHLRQHTIQLDKTLVGIGRPPTEAHRLIRNVYAALAAVETERAPADDLRADVARTIAERATAIAT